MLKVCRRGWLAHQNVPLVLHFLPLQIVNSWIFSAANVREKYALSQWWYFPCCWVFNFFFFILSRAEQAWLLIQTQTRLHQHFIHLKCIWRPEMCLTTQWGCGQQGRNIMWWTAVHLTATNNSIYECYRAQIVPWVDEVAWGLIDESIGRKWSDRKYVRRYCSQYSNGRIQRIWISLSSCQRCLCVVLRRQLLQISMLTS